MRALDLTGQRFGRLVVQAALPNRARHRMYRCLCDCGEHAAVTVTELRSGDTQSCGCIRRERLTKHGHTRFGEKKPRTYRAWADMRQRCLNPRKKQWKDYGGRGITFALEWADFAVFLRDMGECPPGLTLERNDVNGNYEPGNCRWATHAEQAANTRQPRILNIHHMRR